MSKRKPQRTVGRIGLVRVVGGGVQILRGGDLVELFSAIVRGVRVSFMMVMPMSTVTCRTVAVHAGCSRAVGLVVAKSMVLLWSVTGGSDGDEAL
jgi:hypothetical protein